MHLGFNICNVLNTASIRGEILELAPHLAGGGALLCRKVHTHRDVGRKLQADDTPSQSCQLVRGKTALVCSAPYLCEAFLSHRRHVEHHGADQKIAEALHLSQELQRHFAALSVAHQQHARTV